MSDSDLYVGILVKLHHPYCLPDKTTLKRKINDADGRQEIEMKKTPLVVSCRMSHQHKSFVLMQLVLYLWCDACLASHCEAYNGTGIDRD